jgi:N-acetylglucosaminyl-diphospho-decaprenol L-rhamnosyltransferase
MISVVIVTYESATCIGPCLASVRKALPEAELVVVDNGSRDHTLAAVRSAAPEARVIETGKNLGFGRACNLGAETATGSHVLFLNPDAVLASVNDADLDRLLPSRPFGLVAPVLEDETDRRRAESSWVADYFLHTFQTLRPSEWRPPVHRYEESKPAWVSGAILLVSREEFTELEGFDGRFFMYYEDRDLSHRYRDASLPVLTTDAIRGRHVGSGSSTIDALRVEPIAWSLLGWIQYLSIHEGEREAKRAARATLITLRGLRLATRALGATRWRRARRKARQLDEILRFLADGAFADQAGFCPDALRIVRGLR